MKKKLLTILILLTIIGCKTEESFTYQPNEIQVDTTQPLTHIIPRPTSVEECEGSFTFIRGFYIAYSAQEFQAQAVRIATLLEAMFPEGLRVVYAPNPQMLKGRFLLLQKGAAEQSYRIEVKKWQIEITANSEKGIFYAAQSLRQLLPAEIETNSYVIDTTVSLKCMVIQDNWMENIRGIQIPSTDLTTNRAKRDIINLLSTMKLNSLFIELDKVNLGQKLTQDLHEIFVEIIPFFTKKNHYLLENQAEIIDLCKKNKIKRIIIKDSIEIDTIKLKILSKKLAENDIEIIFDQLEYTKKNQTFLWSNMIEKGYTDLLSAKKSNITPICFPEIFNNPYGNEEKTIKRFGGLSLKELYHKSPFLDFPASGIDSIVAISNSNKLPGYNPIEGVIAVTEIVWAKRLPLEISIFESIVDELKKRFEITENSFYIKREELWQN
ncbi:MAG: hypothetical protein JXR63_01585 [Spirochaetales bacterium]|nr:hypothetical protein [Spirochaetales bacterium]